MSESQNYVQGYPEEEVQQGEIIRESPITGQLYRVTRWVEKGEERIIAFQKEVIRDE